VSTLGRFVCWAMILIVPRALSAADPGAIVHTQGGVWVNGYEVSDSTAIFTGDVIETRPGFTGGLSADGSTVVIQAESVVKFQGDLLVLEHGGVSVGTSKSMKVRVNCLTVVPVRNEWTQYEVVDVNGMVQVAARKNDVNIVQEGKKDQPSKEPENANGGTVHEGEQKSRAESEICGGPLRPTTGANVLNPKWIAAGAGGGALLLWLLLHGGPSKPPLSSVMP
jgi:hypothetical protein